MLLWTLKENFDEKFGFIMFFACLYCSPGESLRASHWVCVNSSVHVWVFLNDHVCERKRRMCKCVSVCVRACVCVRARVCDCEHHCVRRPPLGISPHPSTSHCLMSGSDTCCLSLPILSQTTKSHQNPGKDCKTHSFKNKWKILLFVGGFFRTHSLLRLITPRIGIGKVCQDEDGDV